MCLGALCDSQRGALAACLMHAVFDFERCELTTLDAKPWQGLSAAGSSGECRLNTAGTEVGRAECGSRPATGQICLCAFLRARPRDVQHGNVPIMNGPLS